MAFFAERIDGNIQSVSLIALNSVQIYLKISYFVIVFSMIIMGVLTLALQNSELYNWTKIKVKISLMLGVVSVVLFIISLQPYAAIFSFSLLVIKTLMLLKR